MLKDFKEFAMKGNVVDLAVAVIIGAAFSKIVDSLVNDVIMPLIGAITGGLDFSNYYIPLFKAPAGVLTYVDAKKLGAVLGYGQFLTFVVNFVIIAFVLFLIVRQVSKLQRAKAAEVAPPSAPSRSEILLEQIRDELAARPRV